MTVVEFISFSMLEFNNSMLLKFAPWFDIFDYNKEMYLFCEKTWISLVSNISIYSFENQLIFVPYNDGKPREHCATVYSLSRILAFLHSVSH